MAAVTINPMERNKMAAMRGEGGNKMAAMTGWGRKQDGGHGHKPNGGKQNCGHGGLREETRWRPWP